MGWYRYDSLGNVDRVVDSMEERFHYLPALRNKYNLGKFVYDIPESGISAWYRFDAKVGDSWYAYAPGQFGGQKWSVDAYQITLLSTSETVETHEKLFLDCYCFRIVNQHEADTGYQDWLAPKVGLVKRAYLYGISSEGFYLETVELK